MKKETPAMVAMYISVGFLWFVILLVNKNTSHDGYNGNHDRNKPAPFCRTESTDGVQDLSKQRGLEMAIGRADLAKPREQTAQTRISPDATIPISEMPKHDGR